jgi:hypothetical protein
VDLTKPSKYANFKVDLLEVIAMAEIQELRDWRDVLEKRLKKADYSEKELLEIIYQCQDFMAEIQPISIWIGQQQGFIAQMQRIFNEMYLARFGRQPLPRPTVTPLREVLLENTERRKEAIRQVALAITEPGKEVSDEIILEELKRRGMIMKLPNPTAAISTVLRGFKPQFEKIEGKRGVYIRRE